MSDTPLFSLIFGTTASGKSARAYTLAEHLQGNVLSYDSRHVYTYMDVVTGKDKPGENFSQILYGQDLVYPDEEFSIRHFYEYARPIIAEHRLHKQPLILVGGSWLYAQVLLQPPDSLFVPQNHELRQELQTLSIEELQQRLLASNSAKFLSLNSSDQKNPRRLVRAIEIAQVPSTQPPEPLIQSGEYELHLQTLPFPQIEENIRQRIESRLNSGAFAETTFLYQKYPDWTLPAFSSTGYRYILAHLQKKISLSQLKHQWYLQERDYAKRQLTWMTRLKMTIPVKNKAQWG